MRSILILRKVQMYSDNSGAFTYPQNDADHEHVTTGTPLDISHAPFSLLHIESQPQSTDYLEIDLNTEGRYYLPRTKEIFGEEITTKMNSNLQLLSEQQRLILTSEYKKIHKDNDLYGEYRPQTYTQSFNDLNGSLEGKGESIDPLKYITNLLIQKSLDLPGRAQEIVLHPDIIYFASKGQKENIPKVLNYLDIVANTLNQKLFFENLIFSNEKFKKALGILENPLEIYALIKNYSRLGIVIDLNHLEKSQQDVNLVGGIPSERLIVHARRGYNEKYNDIYRYCVAKAIPWVVEE